MKVLVSTHNTCGEFVYIFKNGNQYIVEYEVCLGERETTRKRFADISPALEVYMKYVDAFARGEYNYEQRKSWLD